MCRRSIFISIILILFCLKSVAQERQKMNISQLLEYAQKNSYRIREARLDKLKSVAMVKEVRGNGLPQINASLEYTDYLKKSTIILPGALTGDPHASDIITQFGKKYNLDASLQISQLLFSLQYIYGLKAAQKSTQIIEMKEEKSELDLIHNLYTEYYNLLAIYKNLEIIESNVESLEQTRRKISALVEADLALHTDLDRIDINLANLQASKKQVLSGINVQTNNLKYIIGMDNQNELEVDTTNFQLMFSDTKLFDKYSDEQAYLNDRVEIRMLNNTIEMNELQVKSEKAKLTPNLSAFGSYMYQAKRDEFDLFDGDKDWFRVGIIGLKATIPIFSGTKTKAKISQAKIDRDLTINKKNEVLEGLTVEYLNALSQYHVSIENCEIQLKSIELANKVKLHEELKFNEGLSTLTDYLISENELRNAEINYVQNFISMKKSELDLLRSKGLLFEFRNN